MLIRIKKSWELGEADVTPKALYLDRRRFIQGAGAIAGAAAVGMVPGLGNAVEGPGENPKLVFKEKAYVTPDEQISSYKDITQYNNFYEFGTDKIDPYHNAGPFKPKPWSVEIAGECAKPGTIAFEDLIKPHMLEERIYRLRCVEAWSLVVPWIGVPLADVIKRFEPTSKAKFVAFETLYDPQRMPGQERPVLPWPYREGLRMDEALNPLPLLVVGLYGEELPNQNGAPIRLMVPWKYGFKSIKSIVKISFHEEMPPATWNLIQGREYGFYANVNPTVDHPRWSQAKERRIGDGFFAPKRDTLMFNGYGDEVASLYAGMDLARWF